MKIRPLHDWVIIKRHEAQGMTSGGIVIPDIAQYTPLEGTIVAIGPGKFRSTKHAKKIKFIPTTLKPGQQVVFMEYATREIVISGEEVTFVREEDIFGTVNVSHDVTVRSTFPVEEKKKGALVPSGLSPQSKHPAKPAKKEKKTKASLKKTPKKPLKKKKPASDTKKRGKR